MSRRCQLAIVALLLWLPVSSPLISSTALAETKVDLELVLAVDVSYSMDVEEQRLQRDGYVQAFKSAEIQRAIKQGPTGRIAVSYFEWAGVGTQAVLMPWTLIDSPATANAFADELSKKPLRHDRRTSISAALEYARELFQQSTYRGTRRVVDVSGDGPNNAGRPVEASRDELVRQGFIINGLPIVIRPSSSGSRFDIPNLDAYYARCVIGGPGAFMIAIKDRSEFQTATRQKLLLEIADLPPLPPRNDEELVKKTQFQLDNRPAADCMVGEKRRRGFDFWDSPP
ncbi:MAG: hypothetical protein RLZ98_2049 [Pseudomonadota bacterium]|jgi:hypothetical protein